MDPVSKTTYLATATKFTSKTRQAQVRKFRGSPQSQIFEIYQITMQITIECRAAKFKTMTYQGQSMKTRSTPHHTLKHAGP